MKKLMTFMLGLALLTATLVVAMAQSSTEQTEKGRKGGKKGRTPTQNQRRDEEIMV